MRQSQTAMRPGPTRQMLTCCYPSQYLISVDSTEGDEYPIADENSPSDLFSLDVLMDQGHQDVEILNFNFNPGIESIHGLDDLFNDNGGEDTALPCAQTNYVLRKEFPGLHPTSLAYSRVCILSSRLN